MNNRKWLWIAISLSGFLCFAVIAALGFAIITQIQNTLKPIEWGPEYSTPGTEMSLIEASREGNPGHMIVHYTIVTSGLPSDNVYTLWQLPLGARKPQTLGEFHIDNSGTVISPEHDTTVLDFFIYDIAKGQPFDLALMTADKKVKVFARVVPFPIEATVNGCRLTVELALLSGSSFNISGEGFEPGESLTTTSTSEGETVNGNTMANSDGTLPLRTVLPAVIGKQSGHASYTVIGENCNVTVEYEWGPPALQTQ